ncbi:MAG TPA: hypothetical protein VFR97_09915 [Capillimicrobium sp.]|nr:hypothetical protein [Capillimicrobium sp.]
MAEPRIAELEAEAKHAADRVALYQRRMHLGRGDAQRFAELKRAADGAAQRLRRAREAQAPRD